MIRLFVGLSLPAVLRDRLARLACGIPNARWTPAENLHVTLGFIGEVDENQAETIHQTLAMIEAPPFETAVAGLGTFDTGRRSFTLWAGITRTPGLIHLHGRIETALGRLGCLADKRRFHPHVTLAKLKDPPLGRLQAFVADYNLLHMGWTVDRFALFSSHLGHGPPLYRVEWEYPLG